MSYTTIPASQASQDSDVFLIDVREPFEYASAHATDAVNVPLKTVDPKSISEQAAGRTIHVLCQLGGRAAQAAAKLDEAGIENVVVIDGGTEAWDKAGLPMVKAAKQALPVQRQMQMVAGTLIMTGVIVSLFVPGFIWLAGFVGLGLFLAGLTGICPMMGFLAMMPWNKITATSCSTADNAAGKSCSLN